MITAYCAAGTIPKKKYVKMPYKIIVILICVILLVCMGHAIDNAVRRRKNRRNPNKSEKHED